jgi:peptide-methionine (S)-S-oxide reductase
LAAAIVFLGAGCRDAAGPSVSAPTGATAAPAAAPAGTELATFAGGCFWCVEADFDKLPGVLSTTSGYTGGHVDRPTYAQVSRKDTGHAEAVQIVYDPTRIGYAQLLEYYWRHIDPTTVDRQFCDTGSPYRSAIFTHGPGQARAAQASLEALQRTKPFAAPIVTTISAAGTFWPAESYHQDYYRKNPLRYQYYRRSCGRDARLHQLWGDAAEAPTPAPAASAASAASASAAAAADSSPRVGG